RLNVEALEKALSEIVRRHEVLRTTFTSVSGQPVQTIAPALPVSLPVEDLTRLPEAEREAQAVRVAADEGSRPFDLSRGPLMRLRLLRLGEEKHMVLSTMHHIVSDGWSTGVLMREVAALYRAFDAGEPSPLAELQIQYADFAVWQRGWLQGEVLERQLAYWKQQLGGTLPTLEMPTDRPRPAVQTYRGAHQLFTLPADLTSSLKQLSQREDCTLFMTLLAAFDVLLSRHTGQEDILVGTDIANRNRAEIEPLIGFFVNTLVLRTDLSGEPTFVELMRRVKEVSLGAVAVGDGRADEDVFLPRVMVEPRVEGGEQRHEEGAVVLKAERTQSLRRLFRDGDELVSAAVALERRARAVGREFERGQLAAELRAPVVEFPLQRLASQALALPDGEVGVLYRQLRQRGPRALLERAVERGYLPDEDAHRPAVRDDVVHRQKDDVLVLREPQEPDAQERPGAQVERLEGFLGGEAEGFRLALVRGQSREVFDLQAQRLGRENQLRGAALDRDEGGAEDFVTTDYLAQSQPEGFDVQAALEAHGLAAVVEGRVGLQLVEEPEPLLRERERHGPSVALARQNRLAPFQELAPQALLQQSLLGGREP
ncbi:MAG TPA: condensation domain-containing protein, partial [Pyrinomonadaceae bacterium]|nr:condensation domain-containing protein [Pyrinomonadaceae bacterium]